MAAAVEQRLPLPAGERDIPLMICDRAFDEDGYMEGVMGDVTLVNGAPWPELEVDAVRYRFRLLNASNARRYRLALRPGGPLIQVGSDTGLLAGPVSLDAVTVAPAERAEVVVDFSRWKPGTEVLLVNSLADGRMGDVMRFRVARRARDASRVPSRLAEVRPLDRARVAASRTFDFRLTRSGAPRAGRSTGTASPPTASWPHRSSARSNGGGSPATSITRSTSTWPTSGSWREGAGPRRHTSGSMMANFRVV